MNSTLASNLAVIQDYMTLYLLIIILIVGTIGNLGNIIIFLQKLFKPNVCSRYFIVFSLGNLLALYFGCCTRVIAIITGYDLTQISIVFCKMRIYFIILGLNLSRTFIGLISVDRWMITSRNIRIRRLSSPKVASSLIMISALFWVPFNLIVVIDYEIDINSNCVRSTDDPYMLTYTIFSLFSITCPFLIMIIFSILAILNVRNVIHRQVLPVTAVNLNIIHREQYRRKDLALIKLSLVQVIVYIFLNLVDMYNTIYGLISSKTVKSSERVAIDGFIDTMGIYLLYLYCATTFWLYILTSKTFRKACISAWKQFLRRTHRLFL